MKLTVKTTILQNMVARAMKGASCNKMIPITGLMGIRLYAGILSLTTTDATNYLYVKQDKIVGEDFELTVEAEVFSKLISRLTCEDVTLEYADRVLRIKGNGNYSMELPLDEEGHLVRYPDPIHDEYSDIAMNSVGTINLSTARLILATARAALATTDDADVLCYTGYYCGDRIIATDTSVMCGIDIKLWEEPALISSEMMNLLDVFTSEKIEVYRDNDTMVFKSPDCVVYGKVMDCIEDYQIDVINGLLDQDYDSYCRIPKSAMAQLLDRLILFVSPYDRNSITLTFTPNGLQISSKRANSVEVIPYSTSENFQAFTGNIDVEMLRTQVKANVSDSLEIHYGLETAIKLVDGNVTQVIALLDE